MAADVMQYTSLFT